MTQSPTAERQARRVRVRNILRTLARLYPEPKTALTHRNSLELLVATMLSAQCTDARVNLVTPALFARYADAAAFAKASLEQLRRAIKSVNYYRTKAANIQKCCRLLLEQHAGQVPQTLEELVTLPGIGRKTANVILGHAFEVPGITVDTHVKRLSRRLGLTEKLDPVKIEFELMELIPKKKWTPFSHGLILHGRRVCFARRPACSRCALAKWCPRIGVTASQ